MSDSASGSTENTMILIVDDTPKNLQLLGNLLSKEGYKIAALTEGSKVLESVQKLRPDLILLDVMMPDKNGFEVCMELKRSSELADIPVIFITGKAEEEDIVEGLNIGGADYVTKPFSAQELLARVATHVELKKARDKILEQNKQLQALNKTREKLYSIIGHDLRSGLAGIIGISDLLFSKVTEDEILDSAELTELLALIYQSGQGLNRLLDNLLNWTRIQTGNLHLNPEVLSLESIISGMEELFKPLANKKEIDLKFDSSKGYVIEADKHMVETIIRNLVSNALKFTTSGGTVTLSICEDADRISITVADTGIGMSEEIQKDLFKPDERPTQFGTQNEQGTGLGLILCKELVEMHRGSIEVESKVQAGSRFVVSLPKRQTVSHESD